MILSRVVVSDVLFQALALPEFRKVHQAVELIHRIFDHPDFSRRVLHYRWHTNDGQSFQRFYYSCGRSNAEVLKCILFGLLWENVKDSSDKKNKPFLIHGCMDKTTYNQFHSQLDFLPIDSKALLSPNYTPIHIAAAIVHEMAIKLGFPPKGKVMNECWSHFTVPIAMAKIVRDMCIVLSEGDDRLLKWCMLLDLHSFDYKPCSFSYGIHGAETLLSKKPINLLTKNILNIGQDKQGDNSILTSLPN